MTVSVFHFLVAMVTLNRHSNWCHGINDTFISWWQGNAMKCSVCCRICWPISSVTPTLNWDGLWRNRLLYWVIIILVCYQWAYSCITMALIVFICHWCLSGIHIFQLYFCYCCLKEKKKKKKNSCHFREFLIFLASTIIAILLLSHFCK